MIKFEMEDNQSGCQSGYKINDDSRTLSSLSSNCTNNTSFESSMSLEDVDLMTDTPFKEQNAQQIRDSPTSVLINHDCESNLNRYSPYNPEEEVPPARSEALAAEPIATYAKGFNEKKPNPALPSHQKDPNNTSFGLTEDDWTTQGNRTEKTGTTGGTRNTGYTDFTDATGTTKLHKNGVSAMLHRKLRRNNSNKNRSEAIPVPSSINTIRRPMSFDYRMASKGADLVAPSQVKRRMSYERLYSTSKLKGEPSTSRLKEECNCLFSTDEDSEFSGHDTVPEDGDYHAGSKSIGAFIRNLFQCCNADSVVGLKY
mmetsp:Transcript_21565/g.27212  ORF Transcript_21565/g.27212 Transcript_21565/m.27212 type:complete len:313 (-) Transcript_21565:78-1016(-)